ncbi:hypothetical protein [Flavisphingomonas formosensis]|nr:hypothetical protein [Sphingomonas formosensis]
MRQKDMPFNGLRPVLDQNVNPRSTSNDKGSPYAFVLVDQGNLTAASIT